jgi:monofunctional biosynthetic peptidoglycan transglycosylase
MENPERPEEPVHTASHGASPHGRRRPAGTSARGMGRAAWRGVVWAFRFLWMTYQLALGMVLILLFWLFLQAWHYFHIGDIRALRHTPPATTAFIEAARAENPTRDIRQTWIPLDSIPRTLRRLVLVAEDAKFYTHQGFDLEQIEYALVANHQAGKPLRGASTITQQTVKNLYLGGEKEISRKVREAVLALLLEQTLSKDRILEIYLNIAQFGPGVFGVREGARHHFGRDVRELTQDQMLSLTALLPSPVRWNPARPTGAYLSHKNRVARNFGLLRTLAPADSLQRDDTALDSLGTLLSEEAWRKLRSGPVGEPQLPEEDRAAGNAEAEGAAREEYNPQADHGPETGAGEGALPE